MTNGLNVTANISGTSATAQVTGGTPPYSYLWTPTSATTQTITGLTDGTYRVDVSDANGCTGTTSFVFKSCHVTLQANPPKICRGASSVITATGATSYLWSDGVTTASRTVSPTQPTTYTVVGSTGTCTDSVSITVDVDDLAVTTSISGASATAVASGGVQPYSYQWGAPGNETTQTISGLVLNNTYTVTVTDALNCAASTSFTYGGCLATFSLYRPDSINTPQLYHAVNNSIGIPVISYTWLWGDGASDVGATPSHTYTTSGNYTITLSITTGNGCTSTFTNGITVQNVIHSQGSAPVTVRVVLPNSSSVADGNPAGDILLSPTPASELVKISYTLSKECFVECSLVDIMGNVVTELDHGVKQAGMQHTDQSTINLPAGIYWLRLKAASSVSFAKLILIK